MVLPSNHLSGRLLVFLSSDFIVIFIPRKQECDDDHDMSKPYYSILDSRVTWDKLNSAATNKLHAMTAQSS